MDSPASFNDAPGDALPAYAPAIIRNESQSLTQHAYTLRDKKNRPWLTLHITDRATTGSQLPVIDEGEPIRGSVVLNLEEDTKIKSVAVKV